VCYPCYTVMFFFFAEFHVYLAKVVCILHETELRKGYRLHCYSTVVCRVHVRPGPSAELNGFLLCCVLRAHLVVAALGADPDEMAENLKSVSLLAEPLAILPLSFVGFASMSSDPQIIDTDGPTSHRHGMA
jgi:hypothetical protein